MIIRVFRGRVHPGMGDRYLRLLQDRGLAEFTGSPGVVALEVGLPTDSEPPEFRVTSTWTDLDRLKAFAGDRWRDARMLPGEAELLREKTVHHYQADVLEAPATLGNGDDRSVVGDGPLEVDLRRKVARIEGRVVDLPPLEFSLLAELAARPDQPIPSSELAVRVWPPGAYVTGDDVRRVVYRLRRLIGDHRRPRPMVRHRRGYGYLLDLRSLDG